MSEWLGVGWNGGALAHPGFLCTEKEVRNHLSHFAPQKQVNSQISPGNNGSVTSSSNGSVTKSQHSLAARFALVSQELSLAVRFSLHQKENALMGRERFPSCWFSGDTATTRLLLLHLARSVGRSQSTARLCGARQHAEQSGTWLTPPGVVR